MTTESNAQKSDNKDELSRIAAYLIRTCGLTEADFLKVIDAQRRSGAGFVDTVLALKLATPADIDAALAAKGLVAVPCALRLPPGAVMPHENAYLLTITRVEEQAAG